MFENVDWKHRAGYMDQRHGVSVEIANEALTDTDALVWNPDPKSESGASIRVVGYSHTAVAVITVIVIPKDEGDGYWGLNGWFSNSTERRLYSEGTDHG